MENEVTPAAGQDNTATAPVTPPATPAPATQPASEPAPAPASATDSAPEAGKAPVKPQGYSTMLGEKPAETGKPEQEDPQPAEAEDFEIAVQEGFTPDQDAIGVLKGMVKDGGLTKEQAQKLADEHTASIQRYEQYRFAEGQKQIAAWESEIKSNPEFGGVKFEESTEHAKLMLQKYGSPRLVADFNNMGVLAHPEFYYFLNRVHADVSEGETIGGAGQAMPEKRTADILFGD